jgi:hypothetical protein
MKLEISKGFLENRWLEFNSSIFYEKLVRLILSVLILTIISSMLGGVMITILHF